jgi:hypothetical protein
LAFAIAYGYYYAQEVHNFTCAFTEEEKNQITTTEAISLTYKV